MGSHGSDTSYGSPGTFSSGNSGVGDSCSGDSSGGAAQVAFFCVITLHKLTFEVGGTMSEWGSYLAYEHSTNGKGVSTRRKIMDLDSLSKESEKEAEGPALTLVLQLGYELIYFIVSYSSI